MKRLKSILVVVAFATTLFAVAQAPQKMSYQAVVRNSLGNLVPNLPVGIKISILQNSSSGLVVYSETQNTVTNINGLASIEIGAGTIVSGNFNAIDWGTGTYFIKTETDPNGGSNYNISGTSQLLSVPYALYAANARSQGKSTIYLTGDVTNEEAASIIANEAGPNTENVYIINTSVLTTVNIPGISSLINLRVKDNLALESLSLASVKTIYSDIDVSDDNPNFTLSLPNCTNISATTNIIISGNLNLPVVSKIYSNAIRISAAAINLPSLERIICNGYAVFAASTEINFPAIQSLLGEDPNYSSTNDVEFGFNAPQISMGIVNANPNSLYFNGTTVNLPSLAYANRLLFSNTTMTELTLPSLVSAVLSIRSNPALTSVSLPSFTTFLSSPDTSYSYREGSHIDNNPNLRTLSFPALTSIDNSYISFPNLVLSSNAFSSDTINAILHQLLTVTTNYGVDLRYQNPRAAPTGQGIIDKQMLISQGKNILTD